MNRRENRTTCRPVFAGILHPAAFACAYPEPFLTWSFNGTWRALRHDR